jgi:hypothetical protein
MATKVSRADLQRLIEELPDAELAADRCYLEYLRDMGDPLLRALISAPTDTEPTSRADDAAADEAWQKYKRGEGRPWEKVRKEIGRG